MIIFKKSEILFKSISVTTTSFRYRYISSYYNKVFADKKMNTKRSQPSWSPPPRTPGVEIPNLTLFNSLTSKKETFIPERGRDVQWYCCGPTVYDASHMGHARSYISFDILRRVLRDYFKFNVKYVMNITDIDDKIIKRARQHYLFREYAKSKTAADLEFVHSEVKKCIEKMKSKLTTEKDPDKKAMLTREIKKLNDALASNSSKSISALLDVAKDSLSDLLDDKFGSTVTSNDIFKDLPMHFEQEFHKDMEALNIQPADTLIRVSDVIPEIIDYCLKIIDNGFGYVSHGSVYFDTVKFSTTPGHFYAKLVPPAFGDQDQLQEGEGVLTSAAERMDEKRSQTDFALWKASKPGEPGWDSPWGRGRPGWHIECSVMASSACGSSMDIHTGGVDLKFPHHDNELAQAEAYFGHSHWVRYFLHAGHLTISGCKMSKSLKNFVTIREALDKYSARRLRLAFLLHSWKDTLDYSDDTMVEAIAYERMLIMFIFAVRHYERLANQSSSSYPSQLDELDHNLDENVKSTIKLVDERLSDSVDTRGALNAIQDMIFQCNVYIRNRTTANPPQQIRVPLLMEAGRFITRIFRIFGCGSPYRVSDDQALGLEDVTAAEIREVLPAVVEALLKFNQNVGIEAEKLGNKSLLELTKGLNAKLESALGVSGAGDNVKSLVAFADSRLADKSVGDPLRILNPLLNLVADQRESVRHQARQAKLTSVLQLSDQLRDDWLPQAGVRLEDQDAGQAPAIGFMPRAFLKEEQAERQAAEEAKKKALLQQRLAKEQQAADKASQMRIPPSEMFRKETDKYSRFNERGIPTHDAKGTQLSKSQQKKLQKLYDLQEKKYNEYLQTPLNDSNVKK